jgi:hypothetical protein
MEINYEELAETVDITDLTVRKITDKFVKDIFDIDLIKQTATMGDGDTTNDSGSSRKKAEFEVQEEIVIPVEKIFMGQEMPLSIWLGYVENLFEGRDFVKTQKTRNGIAFIGYNKNVIETEEEQAFNSNSEDIEKEILEGLKLALKNKVKKATKKKKTKGK